MDRVICNEVKNGRWALFEASELMELKHGLDSLEDESLITDEKVFKKLYSGITRELKKRRNAT